MTNSAQQSSLAMEAVMATVSKHEAQSALSEIDSVTRRGMALRGYRHAGPILMVWGAI